MSITAPSFDNAPEWANFVAMDGSGDWFWYEYEPTWNVYYDEWRGTGRTLYIDASIPPASQTLTVRPSKDSQQ